MSDRGFCEYRLPRAALLIPEVRTEVATWLGVAESVLDEDAEFDEDYAKISVYGRGKSMVLLSRVESHTALDMAVEDALIHADTAFDAWRDEGDGDCAKRWFRPGMDRASTLPTDDMGEYMVSARSIREAIDSVRMELDAGTVRRIVGEAAPMPGYEEDPIDRYAEPFPAPGPRLPVTSLAGEGSLAF